jgi:hypothetical protein
LEFASLALIERLRLVCETFSVRLWRGLGYGVVLIHSCFTRRSTASLAAERASLAQSTGHFCEAGVPDVRPAMAYRALRAATELPKGRHQLHIIFVFRDWREP